MSNGKRDRAVVDAPHIVCDESLLTSPKRIRVQKDCAPPAYLKNPLIQIHLLSCPIFHNEHKFYFLDPTGRLSEETVMHCVSNWCSIASHTVDWLQNSLGQIVMEYFIIKSASKSNKVQWTTFINELSKSIFCCSNFNSLDILYLKKFMCRYNSCETVHERLWQNDSNRMLRKTRKFEEENVPNISNNCRGDC